MAALAERLSVLHRKAGRWTIAGLPEGADSLALAEIAKTTGGQDILHVARDGQRLERLQDGLRFFAPEREVLVFPAWDCLPYDRLSPHPDIVAERLETLAGLAAPKKPGMPARIILASVGAALQRVPPRSLYADAAVVLRKGQSLDVAWLTGFLGENGYGRAETVMGLTGAGDLILTATGDLSRNRRVGLELAAGKPLAQIVKSLGHVAEGVRSAHATLARARAAGSRRGTSRPVTSASTTSVVPGAAVATTGFRDLMASSTTFGSPS